MLRTELSIFDYPPSFYPNAVAAHYDFVELNDIIPNGERKAIEVGHLLRVKREMETKDRRAAQNWTRDHLVKNKIIYAELRTLVAHVRSHSMLRGL
jgi:hypothetical protein